MKNIFRVALLTALACLLCFSCTNINDPEALTADKFTVNKMKVEGFLLDGLNDVYDGCDFTLIREEIVTTTIKDTSLADDKQPKVDPVTNKIELGTGTVADLDNLYKSGTAYVKLDKPVIIEDKPATVKTEGTRTTTVGYAYSYYLTAEIDTDVFVKIQVLDKKLVAKNSELAIIPSAYGTKDENLVSKMMVIKANNVKAENFIPATFAWEDATNVEEPKSRMFICGDFTDWGWKEENEMTLGSDGVFTFEIKEKTAIQFKISGVLDWKDNANWTTAGSITIGGDYTPMKVGGGLPNTDVSGMDASKTYVIYFNPNLETPSVKIAEKQ